MAQEIDHDIVEVLRRDHAEVRSTLTRAVGGGLEDRWSAFTHLTDLLIRHEVAEELVVYPELLRLRGGSAIADSRLRDQSVIEQLLMGLDRQEFGTHAFERSSARLGLEVLEHLGKEDAQVIPLLTTKVGKRRRTAMGRRFLEVEQWTPVPAYSSTHRIPQGPTVIGRTSAISTWLRDSAAVSDLAC